METHCKYFGSITPMQTLYCNGSVDFLGKFNSIKNNNTKEVDDGVKTTAAVVVSLYLVS